MEKQRVSSSLSTAFRSLWDLLAKLFAIKILVSVLNELKKYKNSFKNHEEAVVEWRRFYQIYFGIELEREIKIPKRRKGFKRLIIIARGLTNNIVFSICEKNFQSYKCVKDLDEQNMIVNDSDPQECTYAIWVRDCVEADEKYRNTSVKTLAEEGVFGITFKERMILELKYFSETKRHLDVENITLCSGSRVSNEWVPCVRWSDGRLKIFWSSIQNRAENLRSREVIS